MKYSLTLFKDLLLLYFLLGVGGAMLVITIMTYQGIDMPLTFFMACIWVIICGRYVAGKTSSRLKNAISLFENCRIVEFIKIFEPSLKSARGEAKEFVTLNLSTAYISLGNIPKALELLDTFKKPFSKKPYGVFSSACYWGNRAVCYIELHDMGNAEIAIKNLEDILNSGLILPQYRAQIERILRSRKLLFDLKNGRYQGLDRAYLDSFQKSATMLHKVESAYRLANVRHYDGDYESETEWLKFAAQNGGDTWYAGHARTLLSGRM